MMITMAIMADIMVNFIELAYITFLNGIFPRLYDTCNKLSDKSLLKILTISFFVQLIFCIEIILGGGYYDGGYYDGGYGGYSGYGGYGGYGGHHHHGHHHHGHHHHGHHHHGHHFHG